MEAVLVVIVQVVNLCVYQIQSRFVYGERAIGSEAEESVHAKINDPITLSPRLEDTIAMSHLTITGIFIVHREQRSICLIMNCANLTRSA